MPDADDTPKPPIERLLDRFVVAPLTMGAELRKAAPEIAATILGVAGGLVKQGQDVAEERLYCASEQIAAFLRGLGIVPPPAPGDRRAPSDASPAPSTVAPAPAVTDPPRRTTVAPPGPPSAPAHTLPIPDYDSLAASQVVPRLASLTAEELEAIRAYEAAGRARRTILHGIAQLQAS